MPVFVRYLHFMILHRLFCLVFDVMSVSMIDVTGGWLRPPDESGGYRMTDGIACFSQYPNKPYPIPNRRTKLPLSRSLNLPLSTTASVALISFPNYQRTSRKLLPEKCVHFPSYLLKYRHSTTSPVFFLKTGAVLCVNIDSKFNSLN